MKHKRVVFAVIAGALAGVGLARRSKAVKGRSTIVGADGRTSGDSLSVVQVETDGVDDDGNLVVDDLIAAVDGDGKIVATDETIAVITPEGDTVVDETLSVVGVDGELHTVEEDVSVTEVDHDK